MGEQDDTVDTARSIVEARLHRAGNAEEKVSLLEAHFGRRARTKSLSWIDDLAELAERCDLELSVVRQVISNLGWQAREEGQPLPGDVNGSANGSSAMHRQYLKGFRLRYDFKFEALSVHVQEWLRARPNDALLLAFSGFAGLGRGSKTALRGVERSISSPDADLVSRSVCLHALWFANHIPDCAGPASARSESRPSGLCSRTSVHLDITANSLADVRPGTTNLGGAE